MRKTAPDPRAEGLAEIDRWEQWFRAAHEERLRDFPDTHLIEQERARVDACATAITQRRKDDFLRRYP